MSTTPQYENKITVLPLAKKTRGPKPRMSDEERIAALKATFTLTSAPGKKLPAKRGPKPGARNNPMGRAGKAGLTPKYWNEKLVKHEESMHRGRWKSLIYAGGPKEGDRFDKITKARGAYSIDADMQVMMPQVLSPRRDDDGKIIKKCSGQSLSAMEGGEEGEASVYNTSLRENALWNEFNAKFNQPIPAEKNPKSSLFDKDGRPLHKLTKLYCHECRALLDVIRFENVIEQTRRMCVDRSVDVSLRTFVRHPIRVDCDVILSCGHSRHESLKVNGKVRDTVARARDAARDEAIAADQAATELLEEVEDDAEDDAEDATEDAADADEEAIEVEAA